MDKQIKNINDILIGYPSDRKENLIQILQDVQTNEGYLSEDSIIKISNYLKIPTSKVYGLATFYNQFRFKPTGKYHIQICGGTACHIHSSTNLLKEVEKNINIGDGEISQDNLFSLEVVPCMGACGHAPLVLINNEFHTKIDSSALKVILQTCK